MNYKIKVGKIIWIMYILILLIDIRFFYYMSVNQLYEMFLALIMVIIMYIGMPAKWNRINRETPFIKNLCLITVGSFVCVFIYSTLKYSGQGLFTTLTGESANYKMLLIVLIYPLMYFFMTFGIRKVFKMLNVLATISYLVSVFQFVLYNATGCIIFNAISYSGLNLLYGTLRISLSWIGNLMILYNFYMFFVQKPKYGNRSKLLYFMLFVIGFADCILIARVRGATLVIVPCLIITVLLNRNTANSTFKKVAFCIAIVVFAYFTDYIGDFFDTFSATATRAYSTTARLYATEYYWNYTLDHMPFGFGFADGVQYAPIVHGDGRAAISDVGIFGQMGKYGLLIIPIYVYPLLRSFKVLWHTRKNVNIRDYSFYVSVAVFVLGTSYTLICIDQMRMLLWPFYVAMVEYVNHINLEGNTVLEM